MEVIFYKYQGEGNDFILLDNRNSSYNQITEETIKFLCDRRFGIGADGLMLLNPSEEYDFVMKYHNADGKESTMCGNGGRCIVAFAKAVGAIEGNTTSFLAIDGPHEAILKRPDYVALKMQDVSNVEVGEEYYYLDTGSPHVVKFIPSTNAFDTYAEGRNIRYNKRFSKDGTNVNFVSLPQGEASKINVLTYERGVEDETLACGTGCVASALSTAIYKDLPSGKLDIKVKGGGLQVAYERVGNTFTNIWLTGGAKQVFKGKLTLK